MVHSRASEGEGEAHHCFVVQVLQVAVEERVLNLLSVYEEEEAQEERPLLLGLEA